MIVKDKILVTGMRRFEGEVEGNVHDFTKITFSSFNDGLNNDREKGSFPKEIVVGDSKVFEDLSSINFPALFDATFNIVQGRKGIVLGLEDYKFIKSLEL